MNTAQCAICTEVLLDNPNDVVSAVNCGHVFHAVCLNRWLSESSTCPQCRVKITPKAVIQKLFFCFPDSHNSSFSTVDGEQGLRNAKIEIKKLNNDLAAAQTTISEIGRGMEKQSAEKRALEQSCSHLRESLRTMEALHQKELDSNRMLRLQLNAAQTLAQNVDEARVSANVLRQKVSELQNVQTVINGLQDEIDNMIRDHSDPAQLATWCAVLKSELALKRKECRALTEGMQQIKRNLETTRATLSERTAELSASNHRVADLEVDLAEQNKQISGQRKKIEALQDALASPSDTNAGVARRLMNESPAPQTLFQTPKLSMPKVGSREIELDTSVDLFSTPEPSSSRVPVKRQRPSSVEIAANASHAIHPLRITSASNDKVFLKEQQNIATHPVKVALDIIGKRSCVGGAAKRSQSCVFREGYNGFGGHEKVIMPQPKAVASSAAGSKKPFKNMFGPSKTSSSTILNFISSSSKLL